MLYQAVVAICVSGKASCQGWACTMADIGFTSGVLLHKAASNKYWVSLSDHIVNSIGEPILSEEVAVARGMGGVKAFRLQVAVVKWSLRGSYERQTNNEDEVLSCQKCNERKRERCMQLKMPTWARLGLGSRLLTSGQGVGHARASSQNDLSKPCAHELVFLFHVQDHNSRFGKTHHCIYKSKSSDASNHRNLPPP